ncbi:YitT family protein [Clostridium sp. AM58-1XD]|nr:YitT family protein [Clostridium sp. AM58-1XD]
MARIAWKIVSGPYHICTQGNRELKPCVINRKEKRKQRVSYKRTAFTDYLVIGLGAFMIAFAIKNIYDPMGLVTGGISGIAIILKAKLDIPLWATNTVLNIPLFIFSVKSLGWTFVKRTIFATAALSVFLGAIPYYPFLHEDMLLTALFGGVITGIGTGLLLLCHATTGGTDTMAVLFQRKMRHISIAQILQILDGIVVIAGISVFGITCACYAVIAVICLGKVSDSIVAGVHYSKVAYVISDQKEKIASVIMERLERGVTDIKATGMYTGDRKDILFCVVSPKEIVEVKEIAAAIDPRAFIIVTDAREVRGEGFSAHEV